VIFTGGPTIRARLLVASLGFFLVSCGDGTGPTPLEGTFTLVAENDVPLPSDHGEPDGCCLTLSGSVTFTARMYDLHTSHLTKSNNITFDNSEQGTYTRQGNTLTFTATGGTFGYRLGPGTVSANQDTVTLLYGDEGPGSDQIRATFQR
jgi:hypothetical protein